MKVIIPLITFIGILFYTSQIHFAYLLCKEKDTFECNNKKIMQDNNCEYILDYIRSHPELSCDYYSINWFNICLTGFFSFLFYSIL
jgi:hypothetical protein